MTHPASELLCECGHHAERHFETKKECLFYYGTEDDYCDCGEFRPVAPVHFEPKPARELRPSEWCECGHSSLMHVQGHCMFVASPTGCDCKEWRPLSNCPVAPSPPSASFEEWWSAHEATLPYPYGSEFHKSECAEAYLAARAAAESELASVHVLLGRWCHSVLRRLPPTEEADLSSPEAMIDLLLRVALTEQQAEIERLKREEEKLLEKFDRWANAPCADCPTLRAALEEIKRDHGKVCAMFETCRHAGCNSSYAAWAIADAALKGEGKR